MATNQNGRLVICHRTAVFTGTGVWNVCSLVTFAKLTASEVIKKFHVKNFSITCKISAFLHREGTGRESNHHNAGGQENAVSASNICPLQRELAVFALCKRRSRLKFTKVGPAFKNQGHLEVS